MRTPGSAIGAAALMALAALSFGAQAQVPPAPPAPSTSDIGPPQQPVVAIRILNQDRLLQESQRGQALLAALLEAEAELDRDNLALSEQLAEEERDLTGLRGSLDPEDFRARADAFDRRVETIRAERARLAQDLARRYDAEAQVFFQSALPVIAALMQDQGIVAILSPDAVILAADWLDITDLAIDRLDGAPAP